MTPKLRPSETPKVRQRMNGSQNLEKILSNQSVQQLPFCCSCWVTKVFNYLFPYYLQLTPFKMASGDYRVADISLADFGRKEIDLAEHEVCI
jgi:hypothetical protein